MLDGDPLGRLNVSAEVRHFLLLFLFFVNYSIIYFTTITNNLLVSLLFVCLFVCYFFFFSLKWRCSCRSFCAYVFFLLHYASPQLFFVCTQGVVRRDEMVFEFARDKKVPLVMALSGGYQVFCLWCVVMNSCMCMILKSLFANTLRCSKSCWFFSIMLEVFYFFNIIMRLT